MRPLLVLLTLLGAPLATHASCVTSQPNWATNFPSFMALMECASAEVRTATDREAYLGQLNRRLTGVTVHWSGTVRNVRKQQVYFNESFAPIEPEGKAARGMFYTSAAEAENWKQVSLGTAVRYTGKITALRADAVQATKPLLFVDLEDVRRTDK